MKDRLTGGSKVKDAVTLLRFPFRNAVAVTLDDGSNTLVYVLVCSSRAFSRARAATVSVSTSHSGNIHSELQTLSVSLVLG